MIDIIDPPERRTTLGDAFRVEARIVVWESDDVLKVPAGSLFRNPDGWAVFVADRGRARLRPVQVGRSDGLETLILAGLSGNEEVVLHPSDLIKNGVFITVH